MGGDVVGGVVETHFDSVELIQVRAQVGAGTFVSTTAAGAEVEELGSDVTWEDDDADAGVDGVDDNAPPIAGAVEEPGVASGLGSATPLMICLFADVLLGYTRMKLQKTTQERRC